VAASCAASIRKRAVVHMRPIVHRPPRLGNLRFPRLLSAIRQTSGQLDPQTEGKAG